MARKGTNGPVPGTNDHFTAKSGSARSSRRWCPEFPRAEAGVPGPGCRGAAPGPSASTGSAPSGSFDRFQQVVFFCAFPYGRVGRYGTGNPCGVIGVCAGEEGKAVEGIKAVFKWDDKVVFHNFNLYSILVR